MHRIILAILIVLLSNNLFAQTQAPTNEENKPSLAGESDKADTPQNPPGDLLVKDSDIPKPIAPQVNIPEAIVLISSPPPLKDIAVGMTLLLQNETVNLGLGVVDLQEIDKALSQAKIEQKWGGVTITDLPYLATSTSATHIVQGWLEWLPDRLRLDLRLNDIFTGHNEKSVRLEAAHHDTASLISRARATLSAWLGKENPPDSPNVDMWHEQLALLLGEIWGAEPAIPEDKLDGILKLMTPLPGDPIPKFSWLRTELSKKIWTSKAASNFYMGAVEDLAGRVDDAQKHYKEVKARSDRAAVAQLRLAAMELEADNLKQADSIISKAARNFRKESFFKAWQLASTLQKRGPEAVFKTIKKRTKTPMSPSFYERLASGLAELEPPSRAALAYSKGAEAAAARGEAARATRAIINQSNFNPSTIKSDFISTQELTQDQCKTLFKTLSTLPVTRTSLLVSARLAICSGKPKAATPFYTRAIMMGDFEASAFTEVGSHLTKYDPANKYAELYLRAALKLAPQNTVAIISYANLMRAQGRCASGTAMMQTLSEESSAHTYLARSQADYRMACGNAPESIKIFEDHLSRYPDDAEALYGMSSAKMMVDKKLQAQLFYARMKAVDLRLAELYGKPSFDTLKAKFPEAAKKAEMAKFEAGETTSDPYNQLTLLQNELQKQFAKQNIEIDWLTSLKLSSTTIGKNWLPYSKNWDLKLTPI